MHSTLALGYNGEACMQRIVSTMVQFNCLATLTFCWGVYDVDV
jgi:hypothetical protein